MINTSSTLGQFILNLRDRLGNDAFWTDDELVYAINETFRTWNLLTGDWTHREILTSIPGTPWHIVPGAMTSTTRIEYRGVSLKTTSLKDLDNGAVGWETTTGTPRYWAPAALNLIAIYPCPLAADNSLTVDGVIATPVSIIEEEIITLDRPMYEALLNYSRHLLLFKLGGEEWEASKSARKALWEHAGDDNRKIQASAPYRKIMGFPRDMTQQPYRGGEKNVGVR